MALVDHPTQVHPGAGVVAHLGGSLLIALPDSAEHRVTTTRILDLARNATPGSGVGLVRQLAGLLGETDPQDAPPLAVIADAGDAGDVAILLHGPIDLVLHRDGASERLSGAAVPTWVDRVLPAGWDRLEVVATGGDIPPFDPLADLRQGTVGGGGATVVAAPTPQTTSGSAPASPDDPDTVGAPAVEQPPPPATDEVTPNREFISVSFDGEVDSEPVGDGIDDAADGRSPLPLATAPEAPAGDADAVALVQGVVCARSHFNDPSVLYCSSCGISMVQQTKNLVEGPRPALGVLVLDDGTTYLVDADYVIGREPDHAPEVTAGSARPLPLADTQRTLSRVHARLVLDGWRVLVADAGSANGTYIADGKAQQWTRIAPDEPVAITPGTHLLVGHRTFIFETHRGSG